MTIKNEPVLLLRLLFRPLATCEEIAKHKISASRIFFRITIWIGLIPPVFAYLGASLFGWRVGAVEPLYLPADILLGISVAYYITLLFGFVSTALISQWMSATYGAPDSLGTHFAIITIVGAPLIIGSVMHLYPHAFINVLVLVPVLIWSMTLLYRGLPLALGISTEKGMLMASALIAYLLVAFVSLLGITMYLWTQGLGPPLGI
jgi:hypothetical protein